jgi:Fe-S-cluster containining protein
MYFTFLDGHIGYDCQRCGARCCKGLGFALGIDQLIPFITRAPQLSPFLSLQPRATAVFDVGDGCWLLDGDGRCGIERTAGRASKPALCRIFPFQIRRLADTLIVDLQFLQCPLEDAGRMAPGPAANTVRYADAERELETADPFIIDLRVPRGAPDDLGEREARVCRGTAAHLDGDPVGLVAGAHELDERPLRRLYDAWHAWLGLEPANPSVARAFGLVLPSLRLIALTEIGAPPYPRIEAGLPARLLAGALFVELSQRAGRAPSLRAVHELWRPTPRVRDALARWEEQCEISDAPPLSSTPAELGAALEEARQAAASRPLGEALAATRLPVEWRPLLLRLVSERLA